MKNRKYWLLFIAITIIGVGLWQHVGKPSYDTYVSSMTRISPDELLTIDSDYMLYVGRKDCPYCQQFVETLYRMSGNEGVMYYLDTNLYRDNAEFVQLSKEQGITAVPTLLLHKEGDYIKLSTPVSDEEFQQFISLIP